jgi:hypothetical protein
MLHSCNFDKAFGLLKLFPATVVPRGQATSSVIVGLLAESNFNRCGLRKEALRCTTIYSEHFQTGAVSTTSAFVETVGKRRVLERHTSLPPCRSSTQAECCAQLEERKRRSTSR